MASPFQIATLGNVSGLPYSPQDRVGILHDGSLLVAANSGTATVSLYQITNPSATTPTIGSALAQTFTIAGSTAMVADLLCLTSPTSTDIWLVYCSNAGSGTAVNVAHGTYNGSTFTWDNTGTLAVTPTGANSQTATIAWNGTNLIVAYRDGAGSAWSAQCVWTATKAGNAGWSAAFQISTTGSGNSHCHPILVRSANLAGGLAATLCLYSIDTGSGASHSDKLAARVLLDSAASAANANWGTEVISAVTGQNYGGDDF